MKIITNLILSTLMLTLITVQGAWAQTTYTYYEWSEVNGTLTRVQRTTPANARISIVTSDMYASGGGLIAANYDFFVVNKTMEIPNGLTTSGDVKLILLDGCTLTVKGNGLTVPKGSSLTIYGQANNSGKLIARSDNDDNAGIGSKKRTYPGDIIIHGGYIEAHGGRNGAGIGGGLEAYGPNQIIIYDGTVKAYGGNNGAGIGGGAEGYTRKVSIYGGNITAQGGSRGAGIGGGYFAEGTKYAFDRLYFTGNARVEARGGDYAAGIGGGQSGSGGYVTVDGGYIDAYGGTDAAGIGSGEKTSYGDDINGGKLTVNGGRVYANGKGWGAGIGGGEDAKGAEVVINGGTVIALAGSDAGNKNGSAIGSEDGDGRRGSLSIADQMMVHAGQTFNGPHNLFSYGERVPACYFRPYTRIEVCNHEGKTYTINGTGATGTHKLNCSHCLLRTESKHTFDENNICTVCKAGASVSTVSIYLPEKIGNSYTDGHYGSTPSTQQLVTGTTFNLPSPPVNYLPNGIIFAGWAEGTPTDLHIDSYWKGENETVLAPGSPYTVNADVSLTARYTGLNLSLGNDASNEETIFLNNGKKVQSVTLADRTLYKDGSWNTICLPFNLSSLAGTPLEGATVKTLASATIENHTLTLNFSDDLTSIEAGKPYIVKWNNTEDTEIVNPQFRNVTISSANSPVAINDIITFQGNYSPYTISTKDNCTLYLSSGNMLYYPNDEATINAFRAYFMLTSPISTKGDVNGDGEIDVTDVIILVNHILDNDNEGFISENADMNGDGEINISDVTAIVNIILVNGGNTITNVVINTGDNSIIFSGGCNRPARAPRHKETDWDD